MDKKSKIVIRLFIALFVLSVSASYYRFVIVHDYTLENRVECDPNVESCFVWICNSIIDGEDACTGDLTEDTWFFRILHRNAMYVPVCSKDDPTCELFACTQGEEKGCEEFFCTSQNMDDFEFVTRCSTAEDTRLFNEREAKIEAAETENIENINSENIEVSSEEIEGELNTKENLENS